MGKEIKVAMIGLDSSHCIQFTRRMQAPDCLEDQKVKGLKAVSCLRFSTPFQNEEGLNERQKQLEEWNVKVTVDFNEAVADCDAVMLTINDPSYHLEYFTKCVDLGKPVFLDKPMADNIENGRKIYELAKKRKLRVFSSSSLRFVPQLQDACKAMPNPFFASMFGPLGKAPKGSDVVWYGVHAFEMLQKAMGHGATSVYARKDGAGVVALVEYPNAKRGVVELTAGAYVYGGCLRNKEKAEPFVADTSKTYTIQLKKIAGFFSGADAPLTFEDTLEVMAMLDAAAGSLESGKKEPVLYTL